MKKLMAVLIACMMAGALSPSATAQEEPADAPVPASVDAQLFELATEPPGTEIVPDSRVLVGGMQAGLGSWGPRHSFIFPSAAFAQALHLNPMFQSPGAWRGFTTAMGQLQAIQYLGASTDLRYVGAVRFDSSATIFAANRFTNSHALSLASEQRVGDWIVRGTDQVHYWQGSLSGNAGMEGFGPVLTDVAQWSSVPGIGMDAVAVQAGLEPDQSILARRSARLSNVALLEIDRPVGEQDVFTASGYHGVLHYFSAGLIGAAQAGGLGGYSHKFSARKQAGLLGGYSHIAFSNASDMIDTSYGNAMYGRTLSGRLALALGVGPQFTTLTHAGVPSQDIDWQGRATLTWRSRDSTLRAEASRLITAGAGVLYGARSNQGQVDMSRRLGRLSSFVLGGGLGRNAALSTRAVYDTRRVSASLSSNPLGRVSCFVNYELENQASRQCAGPACAVTGTWHVVAVGLSLHTRPIGMR